MVTVFDGMVGLDYHQLLVISRQYDTVRYDDAFRGSSNRLCGAAVPGSLCLATGSAMGRVPVQVVVSESEPALGSWQEIVEVPFAPTTPTVTLMSLMPDMVFGDGTQTMISFELASAHYRARWSAIGFHAAWDRTADAEEPALDRYRLDFWPAPPAPERVRRVNGVSADPLDDGPFFHGTKADLAVGDLLRAGYRSNYRPEVVMNHIYFTALPDGAGLAAELAPGDAEPRVYRVEPIGDFENDPNVTDKKFPGNPTRSFRSTEPLRIVGEVTDWTRLTPEALAAWRQRLAALRADERGEIIN